MEAVLERLLIENLVLVERAEIDFNDGLTCLTGETGAGKTLIVQALNLIMGGKADRGLVGKFGKEIYVEADFRIPEEWWDRPELADLVGVRKDGDNILTLARRVPAEGSSRALAWGRSVSQASLLQASKLLMAIAGQHSSRELMNPRAQLDILDRAGSDKHAKLVSLVVQKHAASSKARSHLDELIEAQRSRAERLAQIEILIEHVGRIAPEPGEEEELKLQRDRAKNHVQLFESLGKVSHGLSDDDGPADRLRGLSSLLDDAAAMDSSLQGLAERLDGALEMIGEVASDVRNEFDNLDGDVDIDSIERRLSELNDLARRYGSVEEAVKMCDELIRERDQLAGLDEALDDAKEAAEKAHSDLMAAAVKLTLSRKKLAKKMEKSVMTELGGLGMKGAKFVVDIQKRDEISSGGAEQVRFLLAANPGQEPAPLDKVASGGELSRVALALQVALGVSEAGLVVFDEIDAGIGGDTAHAVASLLSRLSSSARVVCVTHLPQIAAAADNSILVGKASGKTSITSLEGDDVLQELCRMMGSGDNGTALEHAKVMRDKAHARS